MRLESALFSSREGITVHGQAIAVVGDNVANANTTGYKRSRIEFQDLLPEGRDGGQSGTLPMAGNGAKVGSVRAVQDMGMIEDTGRLLDAAIDGKGFFMVGTADAPLYTRAGGFSINPEGVLSDANGSPVLGYAPGGTTLTSLDVNNIGVTGTPTSKVQLFGNADAGVAVTTPPTDPQSFRDLNNAASFVASDVLVYDSLGGSRPVSVYFFKTEASTWTARAYIDGAEVGRTADQPVQIGGEATLSFSQAGAIEEANKARAVITANPAYSGGAAAGNFTIDLSGMTQFASPSMINAATQDGRGAGYVKDYQIDKDGSLYALLAGGTRALVGTLQLATFGNPDALTRAGNGVFRNNGEAGTATTGAPGANGLGQLRSAALERSSVDIANEFVNLVVYQRGYQANSQVLSATSSMLRDTFGLIR